MIFSPIPALQDPPNKENDRYWDALVPIGRGFVNISNPKAYHLLPGISTEVGIDRYSVAMYHQLHCLVSKALVPPLRGLRTTSPPFDSFYRTIFAMPHHLQHCFAYLAQSIQCSGDLTVEWAMVELDGSRIQVDGWGVPHQCKDLDEIWAWMETNHGPHYGADYRIHH